MSIDKMTLRRGVLGMMALGIAAGLVIAVLTTACNVANAQDRGTFKNGIQITPLANGS